MAPGTEAVTGRSRGGHGGSQRGCKRAPPYIAPSAALQEKLVVIGGCTGFKLRNSGLRP